MTKKVRIHCNQCGRETNHAVHCAHFEARDDIVNDGSESGLVLEEKETFEIVQCLGCEEMTVRHTLEHEAHGQSVRFYPPRISRRACCRWLCFELRQGARQRSRWPSISAPPGGLPDAGGQASPYRQELHDSQILQSVFDKPKGTSDLGKASGWRHNSIVQALFG